MEEEAKLGKMKRARMTIEERMRKKKREKIMEGIRKPIILAPGSKRGRNEEEEGEQGQPSAGTPSASLAGGSGRQKRMTQTPIQSFLVAQTPEEHKTFLRTKQKTPKIPVAASTNMEISSSSASPQLKRAARKTTRT